MKQLEVTILGQGYVLGCPEGGETRLRATVATVDREMTAIRDAGRVKSRERIAVLAALNIAYQAPDRAAGGTKTPAAGAAAAQNDTTASPDDATLAAESADWQSLIARLDQALSEDGHLL